MSTETSWTDDGLHLVDADGDKLNAKPSGDGVHVYVAMPPRFDGDVLEDAAVVLSRLQVAELRDYLTEWLGDQKPLGVVDSHPCQLSDVRRCNCPPDGACGAVEADNVRQLRVAPDRVLRLADAADEPQTILEEAQDAVYGDREADYGHPREDFTRQAIIWTGLLHHKLADGEHLEAADIARCMVGVKLARDVHSPKRDNRVDGAGYFACLDRLETGK